MPNPRGYPIQLLSLYVPLPLHERLKRDAFEAGTTMNKIILDLVEAHYRRKKPARRRKAS